MPEEKLSLAPTLLIGLGGTGKDVLLRMRRLFFERFGRSIDGKLGFPIIGYLVLDTDDEKLDEIDGETLTPFVQRNIRFAQGDLPEAIICSLSGNEFNDYFAGKGQLYPHIFRWLPSKMNTYGSAAIVKGAGQNRPLGRLAFFHHYRGSHNKLGIRPALEGCLREIVRYAAVPEVRQKWLPEGADVDPGRLEVVLVYSLAGGTGAGMFLDMSMLVQIVLADIYPGVRAHVTHFAVLPEVMVGPEGPLHNSPVQKTKVQENAFAALREMEYFAMRRGVVFDLSIPPVVNAGETKRSGAFYEVQWERDGKVYPITDTPWHTCYLVGGSNDPLMGASLPPREINQMIAEHLFLDFDPSDFGGYKRSRRSNLLEQTQQQMRDAVYDPDGKDLYARFLSRRFNIFGLSQIHFDRARMRRAASYRMAHALIRSRWLRTNKLAPTDFAKLAVEDLEGGAAGDKNVVTLTRPSEEPVPLTFNAIRNQLMFVEAGSTKTWFDMIQEESLILTQDIEESRDQKTGQLFDPLTAQPISPWGEQHSARLVQKPSGMGEPGVALQTFIVNRQHLEPRIEDRLRSLFLYRVEILGLPDSVTLFEKYDTLIQKQVQIAESTRSRPSDKLPDWKGRLKEARRLFPRPYARHASTLELLRAVRVMRNHLAASYQKAAAGDIKHCLQVSQSRVSSSATDGSYLDILRRFNQMLENQGALDYLNNRFRELSTRAETQGRTVGLLARLEDADFDRRIAKAIAPNSYNGQVDWADVERRVFEEMARADNPKLKGVKNLGDLILRYFSLRSPEPPSKQVLEDFSRDLAAACEMLLHDFASDTTALKEFSHLKDQPAYLSRLRTYSAPYLLRSQSVDAASLVDINSDFFLGLANNSSPEARSFYDMLLRAGEQDKDNLKGLKNFNMKDDAIVLYHEKAGVPLCYYRGLDALGALYDKSTRLNETHFDYPYLKGRLPEIRKVDQQKQTLLAQCLELTLFGVIVGKLKYKEGTRTFQVVTREHDLARPLGSQLEEVVHVLADKTSEAARNDLNLQIQGWFQQHSARGDGEMMVVLRCAIKWFYETTRERVQALLSVEHAAGQMGQEAHPLLSILSKRMLPIVEARLAGLAGGDALLAPFRDLEARMRDDNLSEEERRRAWSQWQTSVDGCFVPISEELPIPVIVPDARLGLGGRADGGNTRLPNSRSLKESIPKG